MMKSLKILKTQVLDVLKGLPEGPPKQHSTPAFTAFVHLYAEASEHSELQ